MLPNTASSRRTFLPLNYIENILEYYQKIPKSERDLLKTKEYTECREF